MAASLMSLLENGKARRPWNTRGLSSLTPKNTACSSLLFAVISGGLSLANLSTSVMATRMTPTPWTRSTALGFLVRCLGPRPSSWPFGPGSSTPEPTICNVSSSRKSIISSKLAGRTWLSSWSWDSGESGREAIETMAAARSKMTKATRPGRGRYIRGRSNAPDRTGVV